MTHQEITALLEEFKKIKAPNGVSPESLGNVLLQIAESQHLDITGNARDFETALAVLRERLETELADETRDRTTADLFLSQRIDRVGSDLADHAGAEERARAEIGFRIDGLGTDLETERRERRDADAAFAQELESERTERSDADGKLKERIDGITDGPGKVSAEALPHGAFEVLEFAGFARVADVDNESGMQIYGTPPEKVWMNPEGTAFIARDSDTGDRYLAYWDGTHYGTQTREGRVPFRGKIYLDMSANAPYRWDGTALVPLAWSADNYLQLEDFLSYGVEIDTALSTPVLTRIGSATLHRTLPVQSRMRGCLLNDNGVVVEYLGASDWRGHIRDGSRGQVMVEIPLHYARFVTEGTKQRARISEYPLPGYIQIPKMYVSAYEASMHRPTTTLASVVNTSEDYRGGANWAGWDNTFRSLLGRPVTNLSRGTYRAAARKRKAGSTEWNCMTYDTHKAIYWLYTIEYANLNCQAPFNAQPDANGFRQGGLGTGACNITNEAGIAFSQSPFVPCGITDSLGNGTGTVDYGYSTEAGEEGGPLPKLFYVSVPRYRGIENPFGHVDQWTDGINVSIGPTVENGGDGLNKVYVCHDPAKFTDNGTGGYSYVGNEPRNNGYIRQIIFGEEGEIMPLVCQGAGSTTYFCDYHTMGGIQTAEAVHGVFFGGWARGEAGLTCSDSRCFGEAVITNLGTRLCFIPKAR